MKTHTTKAPRASRKQDPMTQEIAASLRLARTDAVKTARMHRAGLVYLQDGKLVRERP